MQVFRICFILSLPWRFSSVHVPGIVLLHPSYHAVVLFFVLLSFCDYNYFTPPFSPNSSPPIDPYFLSFKFMAYFSLIDTCISIFIDTYMYFKNITYLSCSFMWSWESHWFSQLCRWGNTKKGWIFDHGQGSKSRHWGWSRGRDFPGLQQQTRQA